MRWVILPVGQLEECSDTFRTGPVSVRLSGHYLEIEAKDSVATDSELTALAGRYVEALRSAGVFISRCVNETEYAQLPPWAINPSGGIIRGPNRAERERFGRALRAARQAILGSDATVARTYDYLQDAVDRKSIRLSDIFKAIETIEHELGGEARTLKTLGVNYKFAKQLANDESRDERHAPPAAIEVNPVSSADRDRALTMAQKLIEAFIDRRETLKKGHGHTPEEERRIREAALDETVAGSFPASDPASSLPNPDEHDAEGSGVEPAEELRSPAPEAKRKRKVAKKR